MKFLRYTLPFILAINFAEASSEYEPLFQRGLEAYLAQNYEAAFGIWLDLANKGVVGAQNNVADMYAYGKGVKQNTTEAIRWYKKASDNGLALAAIQLGNTYNFGYFTEKNEKQTFHWYLTAAKLGDPMAQEWVGNMYEEGIGTEKNYKKALYWYQKSAERGDTEGMYSLAYIYATCPIKSVRNGEKAVYWAEKALKNGGFVGADGYDVLALSYAEYGDFDTAVEKQLKAIDLFKSGKYLRNSVTKNHMEKYSKQLELFKKGKAWNEQL
ncbi:MAG: sel1 repeat family protein [Candidatus Thiodiazotropha sp. (ex Codakia orbicularis)]|nr:sel1 repeat family protein [Candidatus Thiodiazotropha sp. (ex Codakia orbicularis)]